MVMVQTYHDVCTAALRLLSIFDTYLSTSVTLLTSTVTCGKVALILHVPPLKHRAAVLFLDCFPFPFFLGEAILHTVRLYTFGSTHNAEGSRTLYGNDTETTRAHSEVGLRIGSVRFPLKVCTDIMIL